MDLSIERNGECMKADDGLIPLRSFACMVHSFKGCVI